MPQVRARSVGANLGAFDTDRYYDRDVRNHDEFERSGSQRPSRLFSYTLPDQMPSQPAPTISSALRYLLPSARDIIFLLLFWSLLVGPLSNRPLADPDIGWHIRTGEQILATHSIPRTDSFSSTMQGQAWFAWEWLYDALLGILYHAGGLNGVVWLCALLAASIFMILLRLLLKNGTGLPLAIFLMLLAEAAATIHLYARPHIVSWFFSLFWFVALERWEQQTAPRWLPCFFPVSMALWVNLHGGWIFGLTLLGTYALAAFLESLRTADPFARIRNWKRAQALGWVLLGSALATLVNPYGWRLHAHIYRYLSDRYLINRIDEFQSPDFHGWAQRCFGTILLLVLVGFAGTRRAVRLRHLLVALLAVYAGLYASRNLPVSSMLLVLIAGPILWENFISLAEKPGCWTWARGWVGRIGSFSERMCAQELRLQGHLWPVATVIAALAICTQGGRLGSRQVMQAQFDPLKLPVAAVGSLQQERSPEPIFSTDAWSGYLIYRLYPERKVMVDDRHDLYGSSRIREYLILLQGEPGWENVLEKWQIQSALLPTRSTLANLLRELPQGWHPVYEDNVAVVFERKAKEDLKLKP